MLSVLGLILVKRSFSASLLTAQQRPNSALVAVFAAVAVMLSLTLLWPWAQALFRFGPLHGDDLAVTVGAGAALLILLELVKPLWRRSLLS